MITTPQPHGVRLDAVRRADLPTLFTWINDREQVIYNAAYKPVHETDHEAWFEGVRKRADMRLFAIRERFGDLLIGTCQLHSIHPISRSAELQIRIGDTAQQNRGYGSDALTQLVAFAFDDLNLNRVFLHVFATNARAISSYRKIGFVIEGTLREAAFIDGAFVDVLVMAILQVDRSQ